MNKYLKIAVSVVAVTMIILIVNVALQEKAPADLSGEVMEREPEKQPEPPIQPENDSSAPPAKVIPPEELEGFQRLLFYAVDDRSTNLILEFTRESMPEQPAVYALHKSDAIFHITFNKPLHKEIKAMIHLEGTVEYTTEIKNAEEIVIQVKDVQNDFTLHIEEQAPLTFYRQQSLQYSIDTDLLQNKDHLVVRSEFGTQILLSEKEEHVMLRFPEAMIQSDVVGGQASGKWIDDVSYLIELGDERETYFTFERLFSVSGNYPLGWDHSISVKKVPKQIWKDAHSGQRVGWSERDRFYTEIIPSPDHEQYVGLIDLGPPHGDGDGWSYAVYLEQKNKEPVVIESTFYSTIEPYGSPVQWIDNDTLLYSTYFGIYTYQISTKEKTVIYESKDYENDVNFVVYDPHRSQLYALMYNDNPIFYDQVEKPSNDVIDLWIYGDLQSPPIVHENFSGVVDSSKYSHLNLVVHPVAEGIYWTIAEDDRVYTVYEVDQESQESQEDSQSSLRTEGHVLAMLEQGVVLYNRPYGAHEDNLSTAYQIWQVDEKLGEQSGEQSGRQLVEQHIAMPDPPEPGHVGKIGDLLLVQSDEKTLYYYSADVNKWKESKTVSPEDHFPYRSANSYYRTAE